MKNDNNFASLSECNSICYEFLNNEAKSTADIKLEITTDVQDMNNDAEFDIDDSDECSLPVMPGNCFQELERWFFDSTSNTCKRFKYGGCNGNKNNFQTREQCESRCTSQITQIHEGIFKYFFKYFIDKKNAPKQKVRIFVN